MQQKRRLLIIYPYEWLAYAPTVLRLCKEFSSELDVRVVAYAGGSFCPTKVDLPEVEYIRLPRWLTFVADWLVRHFPNGEKRWHFFHVARALHLWWHLRGAESEEVFASDYSGMWVAQRVFPQERARLHFLSLEIYDSDFFAKRLDVERIASVVVQSETRFDWLFPAKKPPVFYLQNAPTFSGDKVKRDQTHGRKRSGLVYCGTALPRFGILRILEFLRATPEHRLTIQGLVNSASEQLLQSYSDLIDSGRLSIRRDYLDSESLLAWLENFRVGLCFYDFDHLPDDQFNYKTVPSGKLFNYFAAGVPVVGVDIPGLAPVTEFNAGVLITDLSPRAIAEAVEEVEANFAQLSANALQAAAHYSFDKLVTPFRQFVLGSTDRDALSAA